MSLRVTASEKKCAQFNDAKLFKCSSRGHVMCNIITPSGHRLPFRDPSAPWLTIQYVWSLMQLQYVKCPQRDTLHSNPSAAENATNLVTGCTRLTAPSLAKSKLQEPLPIGSNVPFYRWVGGGIFVLLWFLAKLRGAFKCVLRNCVMAGFNIFGNINELKIYACPGCLRFVCKFTTVLYS